MIKILNHPTELSPERKQQIENYKELLKHLMDKGYTKREAQNIIFHIDED